MLYLNFVICNNKLSILCQNYYHEILTITNHEYEFKSNGFFYLDERIKFQKSIMYNFSYELLDDHIRSYGYFEYPDVAEDLFTIQHIVKLSSKSTIKYLMQSGIKYECDIDLKNFINNEQLLRESKLNKILN